MARYTITYKCGCTEEMNLFGKSVDRERKIAYYNTIDCPHCRAKQAEQEAAESGLPALAGSDKQIAWAADIRKSSLILVEQFRAAATKPEIVERLIAAHLSQTSASYWINNRDEISGGSLRRFVEFVAGFNPDILKTV